MKKFYEIFLEVCPHGDFKENWVRYRPYLAEPASPEAKSTVTIANAMVKDFWKGRRSSDFQEDYVDNLADDEDLEKIFDKALPKVENIEWAKKNKANIIRLFKSFINEKVMCSCNGYIESKGPLGYPQSEWKPNGTIEVHYWEDKETVIIRDDAFDD